MMKFEKKLRNYFGRQDLCIQLLEKEKKQSALKSSDEKDKGVFDSMESHISQVFDHVAPEVSIREVRADSLSR